MLFPGPKNLLDSWQKILCSETTVVATFVSFTIQGRRHVSSLLVWKSYEVYNKFITGPMMRYLSKFVFAVFILCGDLCGLCLVARLSTGTHPRTSIYRSRTHASSCWRSRAIRRRQCSATSWSMPSTSARPSTWMTTLVSMSTSSMRVTFKSQKTSTCVSFTYTRNPLAFHIQTHNTSRLFLYKKIHLLSAYTQHRTSFKHISILYYNFSCVVSCLIVSVILLFLTSTFYLVETHQKKS